MERAKKVAVVALVVLGLGVFGYFQYASASQIEISLEQSERQSRDEHGSNYDVELRFDNPSLLTLAAGESEFFIISEDEVVGKGSLEPFTLQPLDSSYARGTVLVDRDADEAQSITISGTIRYDALLTSIDVPFVYQPTDEQAREFIHQG